MKETNQAKRAGNITNILTADELISLAEQYEGLKVELEEAITAFNNANDGNHLDSIDILAQRDKELSLALRMNELLLKTSMHYAQHSCELMAERTKHLEELALEQAKYIKLGDECIKLGDKLQNKIDDVNRILLDAVEYCGQSIN